ncbi:MAG: DUF692 domain-containing protein [Hylemonella sp.]|nr:DUF692 domain-containing protein [Hylemonella sp.]
MEHRSVPPAASLKEAASVGIGWRHPHYGEVLETLPALAFLEVHSENFFGAGGAALAVLEQGRAHYPVSLHGVGLGLGSVAGIDPWHLERLAILVQRIEPMLVSDHACFARAPLSGQSMPVHAADLLPIPFSREALAVLCRNVEQVQERLRRPLLVENLSSYIPCPGQEMGEAQFLGELARRSGCRLLLDVNNLYVNARNAALRGEEADPLAAVRRTIDALDPAHVGEIHLAGHAEVAQAGVRMLIDDHGSRVCEEVWTLYVHARARLGRVPTLIEWDTEVPALSVLLDEATRAAALVSSLPETVCT